MKFDQNPRPNYGFIYILGNKSMPGIYKVGITTNSVLQRAIELSSTGVPTKFGVEKIFEINQEDLRIVESESHSRLKVLNFHQGKEFFRAPIKDIIEIVEDVILSKTGIRAPDIVGLAIQRAETERLRAQESYEAWKKQQAELQERQRIIQVAAWKKRDREEFYKKSVLEAERLAHSRIREKTESRLGYNNEPLTKKNLILCILFLLYVPIMIYGSKISDFGSFLFLVGICGNIYIVYQIAWKPNKFDFVFAINIEKYSKIERQKILDEKMRLYDQYSK